MVRRGLRATVKRMFFPYMSKNLQFLLILEPLCEGRFWGPGHGVHSCAVPIEFRLYGTEQYGYLLLEKFPARESSDRGISHARVLGARVLLRGEFTVLRTPAAH